jgi:hypothetical protein
MEATLRARLTGPAFRFAMLLRDFGHLDDVGLSQLLVTVIDDVDVGEPGSEPDIDLATLRRAAARQLFETTGEGAGVVLAEDWPLLFS